MADSADSADSGGGLVGVEAEVLRVLAEVRATTVEELMTDQRGPDGDLEVESPEAEAVLAIMETRLGRRFATSGDLEPEVLCTVKSLSRLIYRTLAPVVAGSRDVK